MEVLPRLVFALFDKLFLWKVKSNLHINFGALQRGGWQITKCLWQEKVGAVTCSIPLGQTVISGKFQEMLNTQTFAIPFVALLKSIKWRF